MRLAILLTNSYLAATGLWLAAASHGHAGQPPVTAVPPAAAADILAYYPSAARAAGVEGRALLACAGLEHGAPQRCKIVSEEPAGQGFGAAALAIAGHAAQNPALHSVLAGFPMQVVFKLSPPSIKPDLFRQPPSTGMPSWSRRPSGDDVARVYPREAARMGLEGRVDMLCKVERDGRMSGCSATAVPAGIGFEGAALKLAPLFRMKWEGGAGPVDKGTVHIPMRFEFAGH